MPKITYANCRHCGRHRNEVGVLSHTRLCEECSESLLRENMHGIHTQTGVAYQRWRMGQVSRLLGGEVTGALFKAGAFRIPVDEIRETR